MKTIKVIVMSRNQAENYIPEDGEVCISIRSQNPNHPAYGDSDRENVLSNKFEDILRLQFDDIDITKDFQSDHGFEWTPFTAEQALEVKNFVNKHIHTKKKLIVHCWGGVSRSRSMAAAICKRYYLYHEFDVCNHYVYNLVSDALKE